MMPHDFPIASKATYRLPPWVRAFLPGSCRYLMIMADPRRSSGEIDSSDLRGHSLRVRRLLRLVVCLTMLAGLFGNGVALAAPCILMQSEQQSETTGMSDPCHAEQDCPDCSMESEGAPTNHADEIPGCLAMVACPAAVLATEGDDVASADLAGVIEYPAVVIALTGRNTAPEPEPPTHLS